MGTDITKQFWKMDWGIINIPDGCFLYTLEQQSPRGDHFECTRNMQFFEKFVEGVFHQAMKMTDKV